MRHAAGPYIAYGIALTPEQQANLTQDIVWLEAQTVTGQQVLVPRLYLASATRENIDPNSARLAANTTQIAAQSVANSGQIAGWSGIEIDTSSDTANFGGSLTSSADITIRSGGTFDNRSGTIDGQNVSIAAANIINSTAVTRDTWFNGYTDRAHQLARIQARGTLDIDSSGSYEAVGSETTAGGDLTIRAGDTVTIAALGLETWRDDKIDGGYDRESSLTNRSAHVQAGGNVTITGGGDVGLAGANVTAGANATLTSETGNVTIVGVQDTRTSSLRLTIESGGFLGTKTEIERDTASATTEASTVTAGGDVTIASKSQNVTVQASELESGGQTTLSAEQGQVALLANKDTDFAQDKKREEDIGWWNSRDQGHNRETVRQVKIDAEGGLKIVAGQGVIAEIEATGSLDGAITQLSEKSGMAWVGQLRERNDVEWRKIKPALEEWDYKAQGLTEAGAALVALAVTAISAGTLSQFSAALASALPAGMQSAATTAALKAGMTSLVSRASVSMINNGGDLGAVLKELGSSSSLKALATAMLSAGITAGLPTDVLPKALPGETLTFTQEIQAGLVESVTRASLETAIQGERFDQALLSNLKFSAANLIGAQFAEKIGTAARNGDIDEVTRYIAHAALGCGLGSATSSSAGQGCAGGAVGAVVGEIAAEAYVKAFIKEQIVTGEFIRLDPRAQHYVLDELKQYGVNLARLSGGIAAFFASGGSAEATNAGAFAGANAAENNAICAGLCIAAAIIIGAAVASAGVEAGFQYYNHGEIVDWGKVGRGGLKGAAGGTIAVVTLGSGVLVAVGAGVSGELVIGAADRAVFEGAEQALVFDEMVKDGAGAILGISGGVVVAKFAVAAQGTLKQIWVNRIPDVPENVPYFRVEGGGSGNAVSQHRITSNPDGSISINSGCSGQLCVSAGNSDHATYFLTHKRSDGTVVVFDVDRATHNRIMEAAVPQRPVPGISRDINAPKIVDPSKPGTAIELPKMWDSILENGASNSRTLTSEEFLKEFGDLK